MYNVIAKEVINLRFIDIHGHYAWDIDDGMPSQEMARKALIKASRQGIRDIVATPHIMSGKTTVEEKEKILKRIDDLKKLAKRYDIHVTQGCELMLTSHISEAMDDSVFIPFENTQYLLCEYNVRKLNSDFLDVFDIYIKEVIYRGYKPIVAHVERYFNDDIDLDYVRFLIELGCVIQVNTTSVLGLGSEQHHLNALKLLDEQLVHVIATDTHRADGPRCPNMNECYEYLYKKGYQVKYMNLLLEENPKRIIQNHNILLPKFKKRSKISQLVHQLPFVKS